MLGVKPESLEAEAVAGRVPFVMLGVERLFPVEAVRKTLYALSVQGVKVKMEFDPITQAYVRAICDLKKENPNLTPAELQAAVRKQRKKNRGGK